MATTSVLVTFATKLKTGKDSLLNAYRKFITVQIKLYMVVIEAVQNFLESTFGPAPIPRNVEIKARVKEIEKVEARIYELTESLGTILLQEDTFFRVPTGRLHLRVVDSNPNGVLIHYERSDVSGPKSSECVLTPVEDAAAIRETLSRALGVLGRVEKHRRLYIYGQTRIHLDDVSGLGSFIELEVVLEDGQTTEEGTKIAENIMKKLDIRQEDLVTGAYMDLLLQNRLSSLPETGNGNVPVPLSM